MQKYNYWKILFLLLFSLSLQACKIVDIRTTEVKQEFDEAKGKALLQKMAVAHQLDQWDQINTYSLQLKDQFYGLAKRFGNPYPKGKADLDLVFIPKTFTGKGTFKSGKWKDKLWGIQSWKTYTKDESDQITFHAKNDSDIEFWLPTYQYFIETPQRIFEADIISYAGTREKNGQAYDLVFASWKTDRPQKNMDQYILWINRNTRQLDFLHYTVRDAFRWIHGTMIFEQYYTQDAKPLIPKTMTVLFFSPKSKKVMHKIQIDQVKFNVIQKSELMPQPNLGTKGKLD